MTDKPEAEVRADLQLLLECLNCQLDNPSGAKQALLTISSICSSNSNTKDYFNELGGLEYILNIVSTTQYVPVKESALYCLGCCVERNAALQKKVSTSSIFSTLYGLLTSTSSGIRLQQTVAFLILCIVANNSYGQVLAMRSGCIQALIHIFRSCLGSDRAIEFIDESLDPVKLQLWTSVASTLCMCVNNPQNDDNQRVCATLLPFMLKLLQRCQEKNILRPLASFIGLLVANNVYNQDRVRSCGGLEVILSTIQRLHNQSRRDPVVLELAVHMINTLDSCIADNVSSVEALGSHEAARTLLSVLSEPDLDEPSQLQVILTLGHLIDQSETNQQQFLEASGLPVMLHLMGEVVDEEMIKAVKFVLQSCIQSGNSEMSVRAGPKSHLANQMNKMGHQIQGVYGEEPGNRLSNVDGMILDKINQLSDKLEAMERSGLAVDKQLPIFNRDTAKNVALTTSSCQDFLGPALLNNWNDNVEQVELPSKLKSHSRKLKQKQSITKCDTSLNIQKQSRGPEQSDILTDLNDSNSSSFEDESIVPNSCNQDYSRISRKTRKVAQKGIGVITRKKQATVTKEEMLELQTANCHLLENITKEQARCLALEEESVLLKGKMARKKQKEETTEDIDSLSSDQESIVPESFHENHSDISKETNKQTKEVSKKNTRNQVTDAKVTGLQNDKEHLIKKLTKEQVRCEVLEKEAVSLREQVSKQKQKDDEAEALREELEKQERQASVLLSSQSSVESQEDNQELQFNTLNDQNSEKSRTMDALKINLSGATEPYQSEEKQVVFTKPDPPSSRTATARSRASSSIPKRSNIKITGNSNKIKQHRSSAKSLTNSNSKKTNVSQNLQRDWCQEERTTTNTLKSDIGRTKSVDVDTRQPQSSTCTFVQRPKSMQSYNAMSDLNSSFSSDVTCLSEFDNDLMRQAKGTQNSRHRCGNNSYMHSVSMRSHNSWSVKRRSIVLTSTPLHQINLSHQTDPKTHPKPICYDRETWSVKPIRNGLKHLTSGLHSNNSDFTYQSFRESFDGHTQFIDPNQTETSSILRKNRSYLEKRSDLCPGCSSSKSCGLPCLNSRTFNIALETNPHTCATHRHIRKLERLFIKQKNKEQGQSLQKSRPLEALNHTDNFLAPGYSKSGDYTGSVYHFPSSDDEHAKQDVSPPLLDCDSPQSPTYIQENLVQKSRKVRVPYTEEETANLLHGVTTLGKHWNQILCSYPFHPSRSAVDLMDKYKRIKANDRSQSVSGESEVTNIAGPFSLCEERRLRRGVKQFGYNWKLILEAYRFAKGRTREELRSKWRCLHKRSLQEN